MKRRAGYIAILFVLLSISAARAGVDTLKGTSQVEDCIIYSWANCNGEVPGEDCRRYNAGSITNLQVGGTDLARERRALVKLPGWDGTIPDSSTLLVYCKGEADTMDRKIFLYPVTRQFYEGTELSYNLGNYPDPDSGATWNHAWLDNGDQDSSLWISPGGDYTTAVACTTFITGTNEYFAFSDFNRILNYWDTSGNDYGAIVINENAFPANSSMKTFGTTEGDSTKWPLVLLYFGETVSKSRRLRMMKSF